jgi:hypothetical protein
VATATESSQIVLLAAAAATVRETVFIAIILKCT